MDIHRPGSGFVMPVRRKEKQQGEAKAAHKEEINISEEQWGVTLRTQSHQKQRASLKDKAR